MKRIFFIIFVIHLAAFGQEKELTKKQLKEQEKAEKQSQQYTYQANTSYQAKKPIKAETDYRKAISKNRDNATASYNMGDLLYEQKSYAEAGVFFKESSISKNASKVDKHKSFHNMGNVFMKQKKYDKAVMSYKEALRNNPTDEETRYNLALAKEFLKNNPPQNQNDKNKDDKNKNDKNQDNKNQDNKNDKNQDNKNQDNKNKDNENQDNKNQNDKNQDNKENQNQNQGNKDQQQKQDRNNGDGQGNPPQKGQLSPQQVERILEAMNNEEKKTQEKINAQKVKGRPVRSEKDW